MYEKDDSKNSFHIAAEKGNMELVSYILEKDNKILNSECNYGSALHLACLQNHTDLVEQLLTTDIDLFIKDN